jgi:hypothetical protein
MLKNPLIPSYYTESARVLVMPKNQLIPSYYTEFAEAQPNESSGYA